jgi:multidrug resistance efflux pump
MSTRLGDVSMPTEEEPKAQIAKLNAALDSLTATVVERDATIARLEQKYLRLVRLENAMVTSKPQVACTSITRATSCGAAAPMTRRGPPRAGRRQSPPTT